MSEKTSAAGKAGTAAAPAVLVQAALVQAALVQAALVQAAQDAMRQPGCPAGGGAS